MNENQSSSGVLNLKDWKSIGKSFLLTIAAAAAVWVADKLSIIDFASLGKLGPYVAMGAPFVVNFLRKWAAGK